MPMRFDTKLLQVTIGGVDVSQYVDSVTSHLGFDVKVPTCEIKFLMAPPTVDAWQEVTFEAGLASADCAGRLRRFTGFVAPNKPGESWRNSLNLTCKGHLHLAELTKVPDDEDADLEGLPLAPDYQAPGIDLSLNPDTLAEWSDADMVAWVLGQAGLTSYLSDIGGTGRILGSYAFEQFWWRRGQSALDFISQLDTVCLGFRIYEDASGLIHRREVTPRVPFLDNRIDLQEGLHVLSGCSVNRLTDHLANRVLVQGFDDGSGALRHARPVSASELPPGVPTRTEALSSPMLESETEGEGIGLSCEAVSNWLADEVSEVKLEATVPTWRDDAFSPANTAYLNIAHPYVVQQSLWIRSVETSIGRRQLFKQQLGLFGRLYRVGAAPQAGGMSLPNDLNPRVP